MVAALPRGPTASPCIHYQSPYLRRPSANFKLKAVKHHGSDEQHTEQRELQLEEPQACQAGGCQGSGHGTGSRCGGGCVCGSAHRRSGNQHGRQHPSAAWKGAVCCSTCSCIYYRSCVECGRGAPRRRHVTLQLADGVWRHLVPLQPSVRFCHGVTCVTTTGCRSQLMTVCSLCVY